MFALRRIRKVYGLEVFMAYIEIKDLSFSYDEDGEKVFENFGLNFEKGTYTAILGRNGSGKSTLAKLLCGILQPDNGTVTVGGLSTADEEQLYNIRRGCGMIFQNPDNQIVASVVEEDVAFAPENLGVPSAEIRGIVDEALALVGMTEYAKHSTYKLSGGQKQRVAIAGVLAMRPQCIIFDEATAMLDPLGRRDIIATMHRLNKENGITVINITHYMNEAAEADRIVVLDGGRVMLDGTPEQVFSEGERLRAAKLSTPQITELCDALRAKGISLPRGILHTMQAADAIENYIKGIQA